MFIYFPLFLFCLTRTIVMQIVHNQSNERMQLIKETTYRSMLFNMISKWYAVHQKI